MALISHWMNPYPITIVIKAPCNLISVYTTSSPVSVCLTLPLWLFQWFSNTGPCSLFRVSLSHWEFIFSHFSILFQCYLSEGSSFRALHKIIFQNVFLYPFSFQSTCRNYPYLITYLLMNLCTILFFLLEYTF